MVDLLINFDRHSVRIHSLFLQPERGRIPFFDGMHEETAAFALNCQCCRSDTVVHVLEFISQADSWFRGLAESKQNQILQCFGCRRGNWRGHPIIESHDDGQPYFGLHVCSVCHCRVLLYVSFYELQPARYVARFQGATRVDL